MDLSSFILALLIQWNALASAGYTYNYDSNTWLAPTVERPAKARLRIGRES